MMISLEEFKNKFNSLKKRIIKSRFSNIIEKGKKGADIGTIKDYMIGGKLVKYIKTPTGWKPYGTGKVKMKKPEEVHEPRIKKPEEVHEPRERKSKEEIEKQRNKQIENYASKATDKQLNAAINDPKQKEEIKEFARKELEKRGKSQNNENKVIKQITQTYVKVSDGQIIVKMNKDKTHYKATKGGFKLESKDGEDIGDFKQRIKSEYEKFSTDSGQQKEKVVSLQQENKEDMKTKIKTQSDITSLLGLKEGESKELLFNSTVTITVKPKYTNEQKYTFKGIKASEQGGGKSIVTAIGIDMYNYLTWSAIPAKEKGKVIEKILESLDNDNKNTKEETNTGIKIEDFSDSTRELYEEAKKDNKLLHNFVDKLIDSDFPTKDIYDFIKKEFKLGSVSNDYYKDYLGVKSDNKPKEIKQITQTYLKVSDGQFIIKMNKDKTGYKATKGSFKLESKEGEDITDFKKRLKEEYEKSQKESYQTETKNETENKEIEFKSIGNVYDYQSKRNNMIDLFPKEKIDDLMKRDVDIDKVGPQVESDFIKESKLKSFEKFLDTGKYPMTVISSYTLSNFEGRTFMNQQLIKKGYLPVVNGILYSSHKGVDYKHFDFNDSDSKSEALKYYEKEGAENFKNIDNETGFALQSYMGFSYEDIRSYNLGDTERLIRQEKLDGIKTMSDNIDKYIDEHRITDNLILNRRLRLNSENITNKDFTRWFTAEVGEIIEDKSFSSFSLDQMSAFGDDLQITLLAKKGQAVSNINNDIEEYEYLTQRNSKFKIISRGLNSIVVELLDE